MKRTFLQWWVIACLIGAGIAYTQIVGLFNIINKADFTKISFLILALFIVSTVRCGIKTYKLEKDSTGWFMSGIFVKLGLIGTMIGLIYVFTTSLGSIDVTQPETMRKAISCMMTGMGTALYTTIIGLICSLILQLQLFNLEKGIENTS